MIRFLVRRRGNWTDWVSWIWLIFGLLAMFGPVLWLVLSSFKTQSALQEFPPSLWPTGPKQVQVAGFDKPLPAFMIKLPSPNKLPAGGLSFDSALFLRGDGFIRCKRRGGAAA